MTCNCLIGWAWVQGEVIVSHNLACFNGQSEAPKYQKPVVPIAASTRSWPASSLPCFRHGNATAFERSEVHCSRRLRLIVNKYPL